MSVLFVVLPIALVMAGVALWAFFWAVHRGQFDDLDTPSVRVIFDEDIPVAQRHIPARRRPTPQPGDAPAE